MDDWSSAKLGDVANLILGMILFFSPWLFGPAFSFSHQEVAADFRKSRYFAARQNSEAEPYGITGAPKSS